MSIPRWIRGRDPKLLPIGPAVWQLPRMFECLTPKTHQVSSYVSRGNLFGVYIFPDGSADVCQSWCQSGQPFDSFPRMFNLWHPNRNAPCGIKGRIVFSLFHSQMNRQTWAKVGVNRTAFPHFWIVDPLNPPPPPPSARLCLEGQFVWRKSIPIWICTYAPNLVPIGPAVW